jgi:pimeloyl-ACP methyl ester carboxylesterase
MPLVAINVNQGTPELRGGGDPREALRMALAALPPGAPVIVLIHGFTFSPFVPTRDPHRHILALKPRRDCWKALSWPRHLGFGRGRKGEGLCLCLGWHARGTIWQAWRAARMAGAALADLIRQVQAIRPGPVHIVAHSLGARVALKAMGALPAGSLGRVVLMAAAEYQSTAAAALSTPAGRTAEVINMRSAENRLFDLLLALFVRAPLPEDRPLGAGLWSGADNWLDLSIDRPETRQALRGFGFRIPAPAQQVCHWWGYLRPGLMLMYRDLIRRPEALPLAALRSAIPERRAVAQAMAPEVQILRPRVV